MPPCAGVSASGPGGFVGASSIADLCTTPGDKSDEECIGCFELWKGWWCSVVGRSYSHQSIGAGPETLALGRSASGDNWTWPNHQPARERSGLEGCGLGSASMFTGYFLGYVNLLFWDMQLIAGFRLWFIKWRGIGARMACRIFTQTSRVRGVKPANSCTVDQYVKRARRIRSSH